MEPCFLTAAEAPAHFGHGRLSVGLRFGDATPLGMAQAMAVIIDENPDLRRNEAAA